MATQTPAGCGCNTHKPIHSCDCDHPSSLLGLMLYMPCEGLNPGASLIIPEHVYKDLLAWGTADSENKYIISSDGTSRWEAVGTWDNPTGDVGGIIIKNVKNGDLNYLKISKEDAGYRFVWALDAQQGGSCDCEPIDEPTIMDVCKVESN